MTPPEFAAFLRALPDAVRSDPTRFVEVEAVSMAGEGVDHFWL
jgi:hypothetical protein